MFGSLTSMDAKSSQDGRHATVDLFELCAAGGLDFENTLSPLALDSLSRTSRRPGGGSAVMGEMDLPQIR